MLWAYRITTHSSIEETLFRLAYRTKSTIPVKIREPSRWTKAPLNEEMNDMALREELNLVEEI